MVILRILGVERRQEATYVPEHASTQRIQNVHVKVKTIFDHQELGKCRIH